MVWPVLMLVICMAASSLTLHATDSEASLTQESIPIESSEISTTPSEVLNSELFSQMETTSNLSLEAAQTYSEAAQVYSEAVEVYESALNIYQGSISTTYLAIFKDIVSSLPISSDYFLYRSADDSYSMLVGDITFDGSNFSMSSGKVYDVTYISFGYNQPSYYEYSVQEISDISIARGNYLVYSNVGDFPRLESRGVNYEATILFAFIVFFICWIIKPIFKFVMR